MVQIMQREVSQKETGIQCMILCMWNRRKKNPKEQTKLNQRKALNVTTEVAIGTGRVGTRWRGSPMAKDKGLKVPWWWVWKHTYEWWELPTQIAYRVVNECCFKKEIVTYKGTVHLHSQG